MRFSLLFILLLVLSSCRTDSSTATDTVEKAASSTEPTPELITAPNAAVPLSAFSIADTALLIPAYSMSPMAAIEINTVIPHAESEALNLQINKDIADIIAGEEASIKVSNLSQTLKNAVRTSLYEYQQQNLDSTELGEFPNMYALEKAYRTKVLFNHSNLLSLSTGEYIYAGGAHGNYRAHLRTYGVDANKALGLEDVFIKEALPEVGHLIRSKVDPDRLYDPEEPVDAFDNFVLTAEGVIFNYPPYAIGPYASGEIEVLLPYSELKDLLTPEAHQLVLPLMDTNMQ